MMYLSTSVPTLQHEEPHHPVQVDVLVLPLQEGCAPGEAAQHVVDDLGPRPAHCGKQSQRRGQMEPRCPHGVVPPPTRDRSGLDSGGSGSGRTERGGGRNM